MLNLISIFLGGGIGAISRYLLGLSINKNISTVFPVSTLVINIIGCFLIGLLYILFLEKFNSDSTLQLALTVGFCGAFSTFSAFSMEMFHLITSQHYFEAFLYTLLTFCIGLIATVVGICMAKFLFIH